MESRRKITTNLCLDSQDEISEGFLTNTKDLPKSLDGSSIESRKPVGTVRKITDLKL